MDQATKDELTAFATLNELYKNDLEEVAKYADPRGPRDFWIISHWPHFEHPSERGARREFDKLREQFPDHQFRIYHCKKNMHRSRSRETIIALCDMIDALLAPHDRGAPIAQRMQKARKLANHVRGMKQKTEKAVAP